jgi:lysophospholipid acyltransferase (LPLAT)-like uncharacterized protein
MAIWKKAAPIVFGWGARAVATLLFSTCRVTLYGSEIESRYLREHPGKGLLYASWHRGLMFLVYLYRFQQIVVMASASKDGELAAQATSRFGWIPVRGSSTRRGTRALLEMKSLVEKGYRAGLVVDAPTGPACVAKPGIIVLAQKTGLPILPVIWSADRCWRLGSWDRTIIPKPFSRIIVLYGHHMIHVPADADRNRIESIREDLDRVLNEMKSRTDRFFAYPGVSDPWKIPPTEPLA